VERLTWNYNTKRFEGTGGVVFTQPPVTMRAARIYGRTPLERVNLDGGVEMDVRPSGAKR
jgi:hypothetical protein